MVANAIVLHFQVSSNGRCKEPDLSYFIPPFNRVGIDMFTSRYTQAEDQARCEYLTSHSTVSKIICRRHSSASLNTARI